MTYKPTLSVWPLVWASVLLLVSAAGIDAVIWWLSGPWMVFAWGGLAPLPGFIVGSVILDRQATREWRRLNGNGRSAS